MRRFPSHVVRLTLSFVCVALATCGKPTVAPAPTGPAPVDDVGPPPEAQRPPQRTLPPEQIAILDEINSRYEDQDDPSAWAQRFEREGREVYDRREEIIAELAVTRGMAVADVGAGTGLYTMRFAELVGAKGRVVAVDVQDYFLDHIRERAREAGVDNVSVAQAGEADVNLDEASVDLAFLCTVYHHLPYPKAYLRSIEKAMRDDGRLVVIDYRRIEGVSEQWLLDHIRAGPDEFRAEIEAAGFELEREVELLDDCFFFIFRRR